MLERDIDPQLTPEAWASIGKNMHATPESVRNNQQVNLETCLCSNVAWMLLLAVGAREFGSRVTLIRMTVIVFRTK